MDVLWDDTTKALVEEVRAFVRDEVPARIFETHEVFRRCPGCSRVYWRGTHTARMERVADALVQEY